MAEPSAPGGFKAIEAYVLKEDLDKLRGAYKPEEMSSILTTTLPDVYHASKGYIEAITHRFFGKLPPEAPRPGQPRKELSAEDRERCIVALLASRGEGFTLAVHIYMALMAGVSPQEIANIILLAGIYSGVSNFTDGLLTEVKTLGTLASVAKDGANFGAAAVFGALQKAFN